MRRKQDFYSQFQKLNELIFSLPFEENVTTEQKEKAFRSLVDLLVKKGVYKNDGTIQRWRENTVQYLREIANFLEEIDLQQVLSDQKMFFERFIFTPCGKDTSIYATLREKAEGNTEQFCGIPTDILLKYFVERTGKSPYEKIPRSVAKGFLIEVENLH